MGLANGPNMLVCFKPMIFLASCVIDRRDLSTAVQRPLAFATMRHARCFAVAAPGLPSFNRQNSRATPRRR
jgi:hypothetical protein